ncbi:ABC transporter substrate-binding protein [Janibacter melonis]|uniref:substrate-binding domain-containing protein n=1 Tax=Janibacter melonis TaxID=262209 RepID=UPI001E6189DD|nr:substrate-binding domain-containing protein [Janibacter melonis]MCB5991189.1 substrate-binding domain-containing protein [Janibacter melonis]
MNARSRRARTALLLPTIPLTIAACSSGAASTEAGTVEGATVAIVGPLSGDPYYQEVACGARTAGKRLGMDVGEQQASQNQSQAAQNTIVQNVLSKSPQALIYTPADPVAGGLPLRTARDDGTTVIDVDAQLEDADLYDSFVASDHYEGAKQITKELAEMIGGKGKVAAIGSLPSNPITQARIKGFQDALKDYPDIEVVSTSYPDLSPAAIQSNASATLVKHPDLKGFYTTNYLNSSGAAVALRNANQVGKVKMVSWDTGVDNVKLMREGVVQATVAQQPFKMGELAIEQIAKSIKGEKVDKTVNAPVSILTSDEVDTAKGKELWYQGSCDV